MSEDTGPLDEVRSKLAAGRRRLGRATRPVTTPVRNGGGKARGWIERSDLRIILATALFVYLLFAFLIMLREGLGFSTVQDPEWWIEIANPIVGSWRTLTFFFAAYGILTLALNLHWGYAGMFNIGIAGFMAVGVYTMALLTTPPDAISGQGLGLPLPIGVIGGMLMAALVGLIAAIPALRLRADYLAIVTLGLSEIIRLTANSRDFSNWTIEVFGFGTGGGSGIELPSRPTNWFVDDTVEGQWVVDLFAIEYGGREYQVVTESILRDLVWVGVMIVVAAMIYWLLTRIVSSPFGRVLKAIREDELVAQSLGKDTRWFKIKIFMLGCALMGLGGILWQGSQGFVSPNSFRPILTFYVFIALIIGGSGSNTGSIVGAILFAGLLFEMPRLVGSVINARLDLPSAPGRFDAAVGGLTSLDWQPLLSYTVDNLAPLQFVLLGVVLILIVQRRPQGMMGHRTETAATIDLGGPPSDGRADGASTDSDDEETPGGKSDE